MLRRPHILKLLFVSLAFVFISTTAAFADKASVTISAPDSVKKGTEITLKVKVVHSGNNFVHHVDWVRVMVNGKEIKREEFSWTSIPEGETFEREIKYVVEAPVEIIAEANCNMHGSNGPAKAVVKIEE